jgi:hypothetical protein
MKRAIIAAALVLLAIAACSSSSGGTVTITAKAAPADQRICYAADESRGVGAITGQDITDATPALAALVDQWDEAGETGNNAQIEVARANVSSWCFDYFLGSSSSP